MLISLTESANADLGETAELINDEGEDETHRNLHSFKANRALVVFVKELRPSYPMSDDRSVGSGCS